MDITQFDHREGLTRIHDWCIQAEKKAKYIVQDYVWKEIIIGGFTASLLKKVITILHVILFIPNERAMEKIVIDTPGDERLLRFPAEQVVINPRVGKMTAMWGKANNLLLWAMQPLSQVPYKWAIALHIEGDEMTEGPHYHIIIGFPRTANHHSNQWCQSTYYKKLMQMKRILSISTHTLGKKPGDVLFHLCYIYRRLVNAKLTQQWHGTNSNAFLHTLDEYIEFLAKSDAEVQDDDDNDDGLPGITALASTTIDNSDDGICELTGDCTNQPTPSTSSKKYSKGMFTRKTSTYQKQLLVKRWLLEKKCWCYQAFKNRYLSTDVKETLTFSDEQAIGYMSNIAKNKQEEIFSVVKTDLVNRGIPYATMTKEETMRAYETFLALPRSIAEDIMKVCLILCCKVIKKKCNIFIGGPPDVGKTYWFSTPICEILDVVIRGSEESEMFYLQETTDAHQLFMMDDMGVVMKTHTQIEKLKCVLAKQATAINVKYGEKGMTPYFAPMIILSNFEFFDCSKVENADVQREALLARFSFPPIWMKEKVSIHVDAEDVVLLYKMVLNYMKEYVRNQNEWSKQEVHIMYQRLRVIVGKELGLVVEILEHKYTNEDAEQLSKTLSSVVAEEEEEQNIKKWNCKNVK
jgi:hypothetical protein